jgi:intracellular septation protein A
MSAPAAPSVTDGGLVVLEWYDFGRAEWTHVGDGTLRFALGIALPVAAFYPIYRLLSFQLAVVVVFGWAAGVCMWHYSRVRRLDVFSLTTMLLACVKVGAGLLSGDERLYLVWPSVENVLYGTAFVASALAGYPLLARYAQQVYPIPRVVSRSGAFRHAFLVASIAWGLVSLMRASMRVLLVVHLPVDLFLVADTLMGWPVYLALIWFTAWYPLRVLRQDGHVLP